MINFKVGDVVVLKSSGPSMTIESFSEEGDAICIWFDGNTKLVGSFPIATLEEFISLDDSFVLDNSPLG